MRGANLSPDAAGTITERRAGVTPIAVGRFGPASSDGSAQAFAALPALPVEPGADVVRFEPEGLADALERERPLTVVAREPRDDLAEPLRRDAIARRQRLQIEIDGIPQDPQHQTMHRRFACAAMRPAGYLIGKYKGGLEKVVHSLAQIHGGPAVQGSCPENRAE